MIPKNYYTYGNDNQVKFKVKHYLGTYHVKFRYTKL